MVMMMMMDERAERGWRRAGPASAGGYGRSQGRAAHLSTYRRQSPHRHARGEVSSAGHPTPRGNAALKEGVGAFRSPAVAPPLGSWGGGGGARKGWAAPGGRVGGRAGGRVCRLRRLAKGRGVAGICKTRPHWPNPSALAPGQRSAPPIQRPAPPHRVASCPAQTRQTSFFFSSSSAV